MGNIPLSYLSDAIPSEVSAFPGDASLQFPKKIDDLNILMPFSTDMRCAFVAFFVLVPMSKI